MSLPQLEFDGDVDDHVHGRAVSFRGRETPLADRLDGALIEPAVEPAKQPDVADGTITPDDDLELHGALDPTTPRIVRVRPLDFAEQPRRLNPGTGPVRASALSASGPRTNAGPGAFAHALPCASPRASTTSGSLIGDRRLRNRRGVAP
jgi:hypothetical protein